MIKKGEGMLLLLKLIIMSILGIWIAFNVVACAEGDSLTAGDGVSINGIVSKGPISGATVTVFALNEDGTTGEELGATVTSFNGSFTFNLETSVGNMLIVSSGGQYTDEATGETLANPGFRTVLTSVKEELNVAVTALTEIAVRRAEASGGLTTSNINEANSFVSNMFGNIDIVETLPANVLDTAATTATDDEKKYGLILAGISQLVANGCASSVSDAITMIANDLDDNQLDAMGNDLVDSVNIFVASANNQTGIVDNIINLPPIANAGTDQNVSTGTIVTLDGSSSSDADEDILTYSWSFTSLPEESKVSLSNATSVNSTFTPDVEGLYILTLTVSDGISGSGSDSVTITAETGPITEETDISQGLVAYYPFNKSAVDESGYGNDGTVNGATPTTDRFGNISSAFSFDGSNDYIMIPDAVSLKPVQLTLSAWIKPNYVNNYQEIISKCDGDGYYLRILNPQLYNYRVDFQASNTSNATGTEITEGIWSHVAATYDGIYQKVYINGVLKHIFDATGMNQVINHVSTPLTIGAWRGGDAFFFSGVIDDVRIYSHALNQLEIQTLYTELY